MPGKLGGFDSHILGLEICDPFRYFKILVGFSLGLYWDRVYSKYPKIKKIVSESVQTIQNTQNTRVSF